MMPVYKPSVVRFLPASLRRSGPAGAAVSFARALGIGIDSIKPVERRIIATRSVESLKTIEDAARLAAWFGQVPWMTDDLDSFRRRIKTVAAVTLGGPASAEGVLRLLAVACDAELDEETLATPLSEEKHGRATDRYTTRCELIRRTTDTAGRLVAEVKEMPIQEVSVSEVSVSLKDHCLDNDLVGDLEDLSVYSGEELPAPILSVTITPAGQELLYPRLTISDPASPNKLNIVINARIVGGPVTFVLDGRADPLVASPGAEAHLEQTNHLMNGAGESDLLMLNGAVGTGPPRPWHPPRRPDPDLRALLRPRTAKWTWATLTTIPDDPRPEQNSWLGQANAQLTFSWRGRALGTFEVLLHVPRSFDRSSTWFHEQWFHEQISRMKIAGVRPLKIHIIGESR